jgi:hypothetical protein
VTGNEFQEWYWRAVWALAFAATPTIQACSNSSDSNPPECRDADNVKAEIVAHAVDAGVVGPCSPAEGGALLKEFADECANYKTLHDACCQKSSKFCN